VGAHGVDVSSVQEVFVGRRIIGRNAFDQFKLAQKFLARRRGGFRRRRGWNGQIGYWQVGVRGGVVRRLFGKRR